MNVFSNAIHILNATVPLSSQKYSFPEILQFGFGFEWNLSQIWRNAIVSSGSDI